MTARTRGAPMSFQDLFDVFSRRPREGEKPRVSVPLSL
jgi:hypothetical protein